MGRQKKSPFSAISKILDNPIVSAGLNFIPGGPALKMAVSVGEKMTGGGGDEGGGMPFGKKKKKKKQHPEAAETPIEPAEVTPEDEAILEELTESAEAEMQDAYVDQLVTSINDEFERRDNDPGATPCDISHEIRELTDLANKELADSEWDEDDEVDEDGIPDVDIDRVQVN